LERSKGGVQKSDGMVTTSAIRRMGLKRRKGNRREEDRENTPPVWKEKTREKCREGT